MFAMPRFWYQPAWHPLTLILSPFSWIFKCIVSLRRFSYQSGLLKQTAFGVPVIVVGNITVGGTGKTPFVIWLANMLRASGFRPGIVSRGYGGKRPPGPCRVSPQSSPDEVGDEALLLATHTLCPVIVDVNRVDAVRAILQDGACDIVITDDGLQHYPLARSIEIVIVDAARRFGNRCVLPAGPLREPVERLSTVDFVVSNGVSDADGEWDMLLVAGELVSLVARQQVKLEAFKGQKVHAVAGIGNPERFFATLRQAGLDVISHAFPDHYVYCQQDLMFGDHYPIIMTEKDAVKCVAFADERAWFLPVTASLSEAFRQAILSKLPNQRGDI